MYPKLTILFLVVFSSTILVFHHDFPKFFRLFNHATTVNEPVLVMQLDDKVPSAHTTD